MITNSSLDSGSSFVSASSYNTNSVTLTSDRLIFLAVFSSVSSGSPNTPTVSGNGLTWQQVATLTVTSLTRLTLFRTLGSNPSTSVVTVSFSGQNQNGFIYSMSEFDEINFTVGDNGAGAVVQSNTNSGSGTNTLTVTLASFSHVNNGAFGVFAVNSNTSISAGSGFGSIHNLGLTTPGRLETQWGDNNDTTVDASWTGSNSVAGIAVEIKGALTDSISGDANPSFAITLNCNQRGGNVIGYEGSAPRPSSGQVFPWFE